MPAPECHPRQQLRHHPRGRPLAGLRGLAGLAAAALASGCTTVQVDSANGFGGQRTYVGIVTLAAPVEPTAPLDKPRIRQLDISSWGLRLGGSQSGHSGLSLGYVQDRLLSIPLDCRLVIFIRSGADLAHAERLLRATTKEDLCTARLPD